MLEQFLVTKRGGGHELMSSTDDERVTTETVDPGVISHESQMNNESLYDFTSFKFPATKYDLFNDDYIETNNESQYDLQWKDVLLKEWDERLEKSDEVDEVETSAIYDEDLGPTTDEALLKDSEGFEERTSSFCEMEEKKEYLKRSERLETSGDASSMVSYKSARAKASKKRKGVASITEAEQPISQGNKTTRSKTFEKRTSLTQPRKNGSSRRTRSKTGCWICRLKHKKCDETTPECTNCTKQHIQCDYSNIRPSYIYKPQENRQKLKDVRQIWLNRYKLERFLAGDGEVSVKHLAGNKTYDEQTQQAIEGGS